MQSPLPGDLALIEDEIGRDATVKIAERLRGIRVYLPSTYPPSKLSRPAMIMVETIGTALFARLVKNLGGTWLTIHNLDSIKRRQRNDAIRADYDNGVSVQEIAIKYRLSERTVFYVLGSAD